MCYILSAFILASAHAQVDDNTPPSSAAAPKEFTDVKGRTYREVKVTAASQAEIKFIHSNGITTLPLSFLPAELQAIYGKPDSEAEAIAKIQREQLQMDAAKRSRAISEELNKREADFRAKEKAIKEGPRLTSAASVRGYWTRTMPKDKAVRAALTKQMLNGIWDLNAELTALNWNAKEYTRVGDLARAEILTLEAQKLETQIIQAEARMAQEEKDNAIREMSMTLEEMRKHLNYLAFRQMMADWDAAANK
jgi:ribosomal protein S13